MMPGIIKWFAAKVLPKCDWGFQIQTDTDGSYYYDIYCRRHGVWFTGHLSARKAIVVRDNMNGRSVRCGKHPLGRTRSHVRGNSK